MLKNGPSQRQGIRDASTLLNGAIAVLVVAAVAEFVGTTVANRGQWIHLEVSVVVLSVTVALALMASRLYGTLPYRWLAETAGAEWWDCSGAEPSGLPINGVGLPETAEFHPRTVQEGSGGVSLNFSECPPGRLWHRCLLIGHVGVATFRCTETSKTLRQFMFRFKDLGCLLQHVPHDVQMSECELDWVAVEAESCPPDPGFVNYWGPMFLLAIPVCALLHGTFLTLPALHRASLAALDGGLWAGLGTALIEQEAVPFGMLMMLMLPKLLHRALAGPYFDVYGVGGRPWRAVGLPGPGHLTLFDRCGRTTRAIYPQDVRFWDVQRMSDDSYAFYFTLVDDASEESEIMLKLRKHAIPVVGSGVHPILWFVQYAHIERKPVPAEVTIEGS